MGNYLLYEKLTANHLGWFEFKICNIDGKTGDATQNCLDQTVLQDVSGQNRIPVNGSLGKYVGRFKLPPQLVCQQCVLQVSISVFDLILIK